jgi:hypothetical protein
MAWNVMVKRKLYDQSEPTPAVNDPADQLASNNASTAVTFTGNATSYTWTNSNQSIGLL